MNQICPPRALRTFEDRLAAASYDPAIVCHIRQGGCIDLPSGRWYDTRPLLDPRHHETTEKATKALDHAVKSGLVHRHAVRQYLVRLA